MRSRGLAGRWNKRMAGVGWLQACRPAAWRIVRRAAFVSPYLTPREGPMQCGPRRDVIEWA